MAYLATLFSSSLPSQRTVKSEPQWSQSQPSSALHCENCGCDDIYDGDDGHFYCRECGSMMGHLVVTADAAEDIVGVGAGPDGVGDGALYSHRHRINVAPSTSSQPTVKQEVDTERNISLGGREASINEERFRFEDDVDDPIDFGSGSMMDAEALVNGIGLRYVQGVQLTMQMQCEALVEQFGVNPLICKIVEGIWLRFVASRRVFDSGWSKKVIQDSEVALREQAGEEESVCRTQSPRKGQPHNTYGRRAIYTWLKALKKVVPLHSSLAISLLACHIARESVLPTDIVKWALEAKLPYISAFIEIDKLLGRPPRDCPISSKTMFKPSRVVGIWRLERLVGIITNNIGLHLPPVNFYAIARRFLKELSIPLENILPTACKIYEWSTPTELCFSTHNGKIPTRVYVMAILIITIRILYNIHGQGVWEKKIASSICPSSNQAHTARNQQQNDIFDEDGGYTQSHVRFFATLGSTFNTEELLRSLETTYNKSNSDNVTDYSKDYSSYLNYCKEIICAGVDKSYEEESLMQKLWTMHENEGDDQVNDESIPNKDEDLARDESISDELGRNGSNDQSDALESPKHEKSHDERMKFGPQNEPDAMSNMALQRLKRDMEFNGFHYLHPKVKRMLDGYYLYYRRKHVFGRLYYVSHADYYILLRTCAKLCQVDCRVMHMAVLSLEKRLRLIENRILSSLVSLNDGSLEAMVAQTPELANDDRTVKEMNDQEPVVRLC